MTKVIPNFTPEFAASLDEADAPAPTAAATSGAPPAPPPSPAATPAAAPAPAPRSPEQLWAEVYQNQGGNMREQLERAVLARGEPPLQRVQNAERATYNTATGVATVEGGNGGPVDDGSRDLVAEHNRALAAYDKLIAERDAISGYDVNGQPIYSLSHADREAADRRIESMRDSLAYQADLYSGFLAAREAKAAAEAARRAEQDARLTWTNGDPARMKILQDAIDREEASRLAKGIVDARTKGY